MTDRDHIKKVYSMLRAPKQPVAAQKQQVIKQNKGATNKSIFASLNLFNIFRRSTKQQSQAPEETKDQLYQKDQEEDDADLCIVDLDEAIGKRA